MAVPSFTHEIAARTERKLAGMLQPHLTVKAAVYNDAETLALVVSSTHTFAARHYEFGRLSSNIDKPAPPLTDANLARIAELWEEQDPPPRINGVDWWKKIAPDPDIHQVETAGELRAWKLNHDGSKAVIYFRGESIARWRYDAAKRIAHLQDLQDRSRKMNPRPATEALEIERLQEQLELIETAQKMGSGDAVHLSQKPRSDGPGWVYIATRPTRKDVT